MVNDPKDYRWNSYRVYAHGKDDGITDRHSVYESFGADASQRQRAYRDYVLSHRTAEEQELIAKMGRGVLGGEDSERLVQRQILDARRPRRGRPRKNSLYLSD